MQSGYLMDPFILDNYSLQQVRLFPDSNCYNDNLEITSITLDKILFMS